MTKNNSINNTVYLDANVFIYAVTRHPKYSANATSVIAAIRSGKLRAVTCALTFDEVLWILSNEFSRDAAVRTCNSFMNMLSLQIISADSQVIRGALEVYKESNLRPRDAIHFAVMQSIGVSEIITADADFKKHGMIDLAKFKP